MTRTWRKGLSIFNLSLAVFLHLSRAYRLWARIYPFGPRADLEMVETKIMFCLNLPALILSAPIRLPLMAYPIGGAELYYGKHFDFNYGDIAYLVASFLFWWWIGKQVDEQRVRILERKPLEPLSRPMRLAYSLLAVPSLALGAIGLVSLTPLGFTLHLGSSSDQLEFGIPAAIWGVLLSVYLIKRVRESRPQLAPK